MKALLLLAALALSVVGIAEAQVIRHPASGSPAIEVDLPADWTSTIDDSDNLIITSANKTVAYSITVAPESRSTAEIAKESMEMAGGEEIADQGAGVITPYAGSLFTGILPISGMRLKLRVIIVKPDPSHFVSVTLVANPAATTASLGEAALVLSNMKVVQ